MRFNRFMVGLCAALVFTPVPGHGAEVDFSTEEIWHDLGAVSRDAYEWMYFDLDNPDGNRLSLVMLAPNPGDMAYVRNMYKDYAPFKWMRKPGFVVRAHQGVAVQAGLADGTTLESEDFRKGAHHVRFSPVPYRLEVNDVALTMEIRDGLPVYRLKFDVVDERRATRAQGDLIFTSTTKSWKHGDGYDFYLERGGKALFHKWIVPVPHARVTGWYQLIKPDGKIVSVTVNGNGYHDHNYGTLKIPDTFSGWYWGRGTLGNKVMIYTDVWPKKTRKYDVKPYRLVYLGGPEGVVLDTSEVRFETSRDSFVRAPNGMKFPREFKIVADERERHYEFKIRNEVVTNDQTTFYLRHGATGDLECPSGSCVPERGEFITEQMELKNLLRWMLREICRY